MYRFKTIQDTIFKKNEKKPIAEKLIFQDHGDVIKWNHFHVTGYLCGEFTGHPLCKAVPSHAGTLSGPLFKQWNLLLSFV